MQPKNKVQLITYPDSLGGNLRSLRFLLENHFQGLFEGGIHLLPPYPSSGDRGYAPVSYFEIDPKFGSWEEVRQLGQNYDLMLDLMVNHISAKSPYFQDYLQEGPGSRFADMFLQVEKVWPDGGVPREDIGRMALRRPVPFSEFAVGGDHVKQLLMTTFGKEKPSEQVDLDVRSPVTRELFVSILNHFHENDVHLVRLDAVGYVIKKPGTSCFFVEPEIFEFMDWLRQAAAERDITVLPEVHADTVIQQELSEHGYWTYDFVLPFLILAALLTRDGRKLKRYLKGRSPHQFTMLDCHDGIPVMPDLSGYCDTMYMRGIVDLCLQRGANLTRLISANPQEAKGLDVHQICGTYFSMLGENEDAYYAARALQFFTPGIPQIYYVGLLAGRNDFTAVQQTGEGREINRHSYSLDEVEREVQRPIVQRLMRLIEFRNRYPAFDGHCEIEPSGDRKVVITWTKGPSWARLMVDLETGHTDVTFADLNSGKRVYLPN
jgi:sucrose phosphorylase